MASTYFRSDALLFVLYSFRYVRIINNRAANKTLQSNKIFRSSWSKVRINKNGNKLIRLICGHDLKLKRK